jgi:hypothetical protein
VEANLLLAGWGVVLLRSVLHAILVYYDGTGTV